MRSGTVVVVASIRGSVVCVIAIVACKADGDATDDGTGATSSDADTTASGDDAVTSDTGQASGPEGSTSMSADATATSGSSTGGTTGEAVGASSGEHDGDAGEGWEWGELGGDDPWQCDGFSVLGQSYDFVVPDTMEVELATWRIDGVDFDATADLRMKYPGQFEHEGPCGMSEGPYVASMLAIGPAVDGEAESQFLLGVDDGLRTYDLVTESDLAGPDAHVVVRCGYYADNTYYSGPGLTGGGGYHEATGKVNVVSVPTDASTPLEMVAVGSYGDGWCEFDVTIRMWFPEAYFEGE